MSQPGQSHVAVFTTKQDVGFAEGTVLTITLDQRAASQHALGRFRLAVTDAARPIAAERPALVLPPIKAKTAAIPGNSSQVAKQ
jgi:hypothetical protein